MGKVALGVAGRSTSRSLPKATVAEEGLTPSENTSQNRTSQTRHLDLSPSFYNKIGKMKIRPEFFESLRLPLRATRGHHFRSRGQWIPHGGWSPR